MGVRVKKIVARQILDSRGNPTIECDVVTRSGFFRASVPSGKSVGKYEKHELRDGGMNYFGQGVTKAVSIINKRVNKKLVGFDVGDQAKVDSYLMKLNSKGNVGSNTTLAVSLAMARAGAGSKALFECLKKYTKQKPSLPIPFCNVINGGVHASNNLSVQEFMIAPIKYKSFGLALENIYEVYTLLKTQLVSKYGKGSINVGDEGGFTPNVKKTSQVLDLLSKIIKRAGYEDKIKIALDCAANEFYHNSKKKEYYLFDGKKVKAHKLSDIYLKLIKKYDIISIEDPFNDHDFREFNYLKKKSGVQVVGDDLLATNVARMNLAMKKDACNCLLLKPNQIGTLSQALEAGLFALNNDWRVMASHRSGETNDSFISDLAVGLGCGQIKIGGLSRGERMAKYNQFLRLEQEHKKLKMARW
jgi:enolase